MAKTLAVLLFTLIASCGNSNVIPEKLKDGLLEFKISQSKMKDLTDSSKSGNRRTGQSLWAAFNNINDKSQGDTVYAEVNIELPKDSHYVGGYEFLNDTLFLYAKRLGGHKSGETVHSTLAYKILTKGRNYHSIEFNDLSK